MTDDPRFFICYVRRTGERGHIAVSMTLEQAGRMMRVLNKPLLSGREFLLVSVGYVDEWLKGARA